MAIITIEDVREDMLDRTHEDHLVLADLAFTDEDIIYGMKACARKFNSIAPVFITVNWECLSDCSQLYFDGIAWALLRRWLRNAKMNEVDYSAGNMTASVQGALIKGLEGEVAKLLDSFTRETTQLKLTRNLQNAFGPL